MHGQCLRCGAPVGARTECQYCGTPVPPPPAVLTQGPAICVCGVLATRRCVDCDTAVCDQHTDRFWAGQAKEIPLADPLEQALWKWATELPRDQLSQAFGTPRNGPYCCTDCRARFADKTLTSARALPAEDGAMTRQVAALTAGLQADILFVAPPVGLGHATAAWLSGRRYPVELITTTWTKHKTSKLRPYKDMTDTAVWVLRDVTPDRFWIANPDGRLAFAYFQGTVKGRRMFGSQIREKGDNVFFNLEWGGSEPRAVQRVAYGLTCLPNP